VCQQVGHTVAQPRGFCQNAQIQAHLREAADSFLATPEGHCCWERGREDRAKVSETTKQRLLHTGFEDAYHSRYGTPIAG
jgi:hypothetical protein